MKKMFLMLVAVLGISISANAQGIFLSLSNEFIPDRSDVTSINLFIPSAPKILSSSPNSQCKYKSSHKSLHQ